MSNFRTRNQFAMAKIEATPGTFETLDPATHAIRIENFQVSPNFNVVQASEYTGSIDETEPLPGAGRGGFSFDAYLRGAGTAGLAPEIGPLLRAAGLSQTLLASDVTGTAQAGAASTITLAAGASAVDGFYVGFVIEITSGTGAGQTPRPITGYVGSTKVATIAFPWDVNPDATSVYAIRAGARYRPVAVGQEYCSFAGIARPTQAGNAVRDRATRALATWSLAIQSGEMPKFSFSLEGKFLNPDDISDPGAPTLADVSPTPWKGQFGALARLDGAKFEPSQIDLGLNNTITHPPDPEETHGLGGAEIVNRAMGGNINPIMRLRATRDVMADFINGTTRSLVVGAGLVAGKRWMLTLPKIRYSGAPSRQDNQGILMEQAAFRVLDPLNTYLTFY